jgi:gas vesicle protein
MAQDEGSGGAVFVAFVCGAVAGAAIALLWAPTTGEEARRILSDRAREGGEMGRDFIKRQREHINTAVEKGREAYRQARDGGVTEEPM